MKTLIHGAIVLAMVLSIVFLSEAVSTGNDPLSVNAQAAAKSAPEKFSPPYLRYDIPAEYAQIVARRKPYQKADWLATPATASQAAATIDLAAIPGPTPTGPAGNAGPKVAAVKSTTTSAVQATAVKASGSTSVQGSAPNAAPLSAKATLTVTPNGTVPMEYYCPTDFQAEVSAPANYSEWSIAFDGENLNRNLGISNSKKVSFTIDGPTYNLAALASTTGSVTFRVTVMSQYLGVTTAQLTSAPITLKFGPSPCVSMINADLNTTSLKGDDHGHEPTLTVYLDNPAPPGGQRVYLEIIESNQPKVGRFLGNNYFDIPAGATSGTSNWFLGTRKVYGNKSIILRVKVHGVYKDFYINVTKN